MLSKLYENLTILRMRGPLWFGKFAVWEKIKTDLGPNKKQKGGP